MATKRRRGTGNGMRVKIGVMGSASGPTVTNKRSIQLARELGYWIAKAGCILVNGACPGLPDHAAAAAKKAGGFVLGISPAFSRREHVETYRSPLDWYDVVLYTGLGLMERDITNIRSSDAVILVGGGVGTLNEFTVAFEEKKVVGVLTGSGGISDHIPAVLKMCDRTVAEDRLLFDSDPKRLVRLVLRALSTYEGPKHESQVGGEKEREAEAASQRKKDKAKLDLQRVKGKHDLEKLND